MKDPEILKYLNRIHIDICNPNLEGLTKLQENHLEYIPFENLDIIVGRVISLSHTHLFNKVIIKKRGGYCFELNTLYAELLKAIGFFPKAVLGRVWLSNPKNLPPRNHLAHLVKLNGKTYVTDVGFGGLITSRPLDIHVTEPVRDKDGFMKIVRIDDHQYMIQRQSEKGWLNLYSFENIEVSKEDISISNYYMSTHPDSHFYSHRFVGKNTKEGRIGLFNNKIAIRKGINVIDKTQVNFGNDWLNKIRDEFSLNLDFTAKELSVLFNH